MSPSREKSKVFRDSVHGYIAVPESYCRLFIDTEIFQRLRHIEQTSMRVLYPSAHHDRFAHSLGVFHLGALAFDNLRENASESLPEMKDEIWNTYRHTFLIACLLHDCGHAPFSHTFEQYYKGNVLNDRLASLVNQEGNEDDIAGGTHEKVSAILVLKYFKNSIASVDPDIDPVLVARMILGWEHEIKNTEKNNFENCVIGILNSTAIDVDKLDYIARDTWASGVNNATLDIHRLLSALTLGTQNDGRKVLSFHQSALSVIQSVTTGRNFLFRWIYYHHKVCYDQWLLKKAVESLAPMDTDESRDGFMKQLFSVDALLSRSTAGDYSIFRPADGDLIHLLKGSDSDTAQEWLSRKHRRKALWKTYAEYHEIFKDKVDVASSTANNTFEKKVRKCIAEWANEEGGDFKDAVYPVKPNLLGFTPTNVFIEILGKTIPFAELMDGKPDVVPEFFYVFIPTEFVSRTSDLIDLFRQRV